MAKSNISRNFSLAGAILCGTVGAAVSFTYLPTGDILSLIPLTLPVGIAFGALVNDAAPIWQQKNPKTIARKFGKGILIGSAWGATGGIGITSLLSASVGFVIGSAAARPVNYMMDWRQSRRALAAASL